MNTPFCKQINCLLAVGALCLAFSSSAYAGPGFTKTEAASITQADGFVECQNIVNALNRSRIVRWWCEMYYDLVSLSEKCTTKTPPGAWRFAYTSANCPMRYWVKSENFHNKRKGQKLLGCQYYMRKTPPKYKPVAKCVPGTRLR